MPTPHTTENIDIMPAQFLHERDPNLHKDSGVEATAAYLRQKGESIPNEPAHKIASYLGFLREAVGDGVLTGDKTSIDRQIEAALVKEADVPEAYFDFQKRILREQGHGDVHFGTEVRRQLVETARADQTGRLEQWADYLTSDDAMYPDWFKHYTWESLIKLKPFDKRKETFPRRSTGTTATYPELNPEALALVYDSLLTSRIEGRELDDTQLQKLAKAANFAKLYAYAYREASSHNPEQARSIEGSWTTFEQTENPEEAAKLAGSLAKHGTGWCTAGKEMAASQLRQGDFHVFYSQDEHGKDTVPRVAVRMARGRVEEVRGVLPGQELEPDLTDTMLEKIQTLPGGDVYVQKAADMKRLTEIDNRLKQDGKAELSAEELEFLYQVKRPLLGFGYKADPRIDQILRERDNEADLRSIGIAEVKEFASLMKRTRPHNEPITSLLWDGRRSELSRLSPSERELIAKFAIRYGEEYELAASLDLMPEVDRAKFAQHLMDTGKPGYIFWHIDKFPDVDTKILGQRLLADEEISPRQIAMFLDELPGIDCVEVARRLMNEGDYLSVYANIEKFKGFEPAELLKHMIAHGEAAKALNLMRESEAKYYMNDFPKVDREDLAKQLINDGQAEFVRANIYYFGLSYEQVDSMYLAQLSRRRRAATHIRLLLKGGHVIDQQG